MATHLYDYVELLLQFADLPRIKITYGDFEDSGAETGWAAVLAPDVVMIANLPVFAPLRLYDIVTLDPPEAPDAFPSAGALLQRYFSAGLGITYPRGVTNTETRGAYRAVREVIEAAGGVTEGMVPGLMVANLPAHAVAAVRAQLAQQPGVTVRDMEVEAADDGAC